MTWNYRKRASGNVWAYRIGNRLITNLYRWVIRKRHAFRNLKKHFSFSWAEMFSASSSDKLIGSFINDTLMHTVFRCLSVLNPLHPLNFSENFPQSSALLRNKLSKLFYCTCWFPPCNYKYTTHVLSLLRAVQTIDGLKYFSFLFSLSVFVTIHSEVHVAPKLSRLNVTVAGNAVVLCFISALFPNQLLICFLHSAVSIISCVQTHLFASSNWYIPQGYFPLPNNV